MAPLPRRGTQIGPRLLIAAAAPAACAAGGVLIVLRFAPGLAARPTAGRGGRAGPVPQPPPAAAWAVARAADQARIQARLLSGVPPGHPSPGPRGDEVSAQRGARVLRRTAAVELLVPEMLPSALLSPGTVFVSGSGTGSQVREVAR